jgi:hypothetical protein
LRVGTLTGTISWASVPLEVARAVLRWLESAKASWSARETPRRSATFSAVSPIAPV